MPLLKTPILPSIATLANPLSSLVTLGARVSRTVALVGLSWLWGSVRAIKRISVANTAVVYHDGRALATCESGPPMRFELPGLETVGWFDGRATEGEGGSGIKGEGFGGKGIMGFFKEWTTAHPRVDPITKELILYHSTFIAPYVHYSIIPSTYHQSTTISSRRLINTPVPGIASPKMMHDFGVSSTHTVIMDLPLSLSPFNLLHNKLVISYDASLGSRFGVFPRWKPHEIRWFEARGCCIFHTANTWDEIAIINDKEEVTGVNLLACRLTSTALVFSAGNIAAPLPAAMSAINSPDLKADEEEKDQCRLYYYHFDLSSPVNLIKHEFSLSCIPFEFPTIRKDVSMSRARYIYGCSSSNTGAFSLKQGMAVKVDVLVKIDAGALIEIGRKKLGNTELDENRGRGCVDTRTVKEILQSTDPDDPIKAFRMPDGWYAQEPRFVPKNVISSSLSLAEGEAEDAGYLLTYVFDEGTHIDASTGAPFPSAYSELWIIDARNMKDVVAKIKLPSRVPYGFHGEWFDKGEVEGQRKFITRRGESSEEVDKRKSGKA